MNAIKRFFKELKRVSWPDSKDASRSFVKVIVFVAVISLILFGLAIGFAAMWNSWGVGING